MPPYILLDVISSELLVSTRRILGRSRKAPLPDARVIYAAIRHEGGASLRMIGEELRRNHATVFNMLRRYREWVQYSPSFGRTARNVRESCRRWAEQNHPEGLTETKSST